MSRRRRLRRHLALSAMILCIVPLARAANEPQRAFWMPPASLESLDTVRRAVAAAVADGFTTILTPVSLAPEAPGAFDGVAETLKAAAAHQLHVFARVHVGRATAADELPASRDHILYQHPEWLMVPRDIALGMWRVDLRSPEYIGRLLRWTRANAARAEAVYVSPLHPESVTYLADRMTAVLERYPVHGVTLDDLRFPGDDFDYSRGALDAFRSDVRGGLDAADRARMDQIEAIDPFAYPEEFPEEWRRFRQSRLTALVSRLRDAIRAARPEAMVSVGVTLEADVAVRDHLQDWRAWLDGRLVDAIARIDSTARVVVFSRDGVLRPIAPVLSTIRRAAPDGAP